MGKIPKAQRWIYSGDIALENGGFYYRDDGSDSVEVVRVSSEFDNGGPSNIYRIEAGYVHISDNAMERRRALECVGAGCAEPSRSDLIHGFLAWGGIEVYASEALQIGHKLDSAWRGDPEIYVYPRQLKKVRANVNLRNYVRTNWTN